MNEYIFKLKNKGFVRNALSTEIHSQRNSLCEEPLSIQTIWVTLGSKSLHNSVKFFLNISV